MGPGDKGRGDGMDLPLRLGEANRPLMAMHCGDANQIGERSMNEVSAIAIDSAKSVFEVGLFDADGRLVGRKRLKRAAFLNFMEHEAPRVQVGVEASGGVHHLARWFAKLGFQVKVMPPQVVRAYRVSAHKSDRRDVVAIGEAMSRPSVPSVPVKSEASQRLQALVRMREQAMRQAVQTGLQLRALLFEFGIVAPRGRGQFRRFLQSLDQHPEWHAIEVATRTMLSDMIVNLALLEEREAACDKRLKAAQAVDPDCRRLRSVPSIGPVNATQLSALLDAPELFRSGRAFASYLGLVPREDQSGECKRRLAITKAGSRSARSLLMLAAQNLLQTARRHQRKGYKLDRLHSWALALAERKGKTGHNIAVAAVAARLARIAWAVMAKGVDYQPQPA